MPSSVKAHRRVKRILIGSYGHVSELIKLLDEKEYCLFVLFNDTNEINLIHKAFGKKRLIPILADLSAKSKQVPDEPFKNLPEMDVVINLTNSDSISKFYDKRKRFKTTEMKLQKATAGEVKRFVDSTSQASLLNLIPETTVGLTHMFEPAGIDVPITTHLSTSIRNSFRKIFPGKKTLSLPPGQDAAPSTPPRSHSLRQNKLPSSTSGENGGSDPKQTEKVSATKKLQRSLSLLKKKDSNPPGGTSDAESNSPASFQNQIWQKENHSYRKSLNKLHSEHFQRHARDVKKLNSAKLKKQKKAEKEIEEGMKHDKGNLESKCTDLNASTLARSTALTPDTANRIIASREARVNKEICRTANRKKVVEFEKIETAHNEKLGQVRSKHFQGVLKAQQVSLERTQKKYHERIAATLI